MIVKLLRSFLCGLFLAALFLSGCMFNADQSSTFKKDSLRTTFSYPSPNSNIAKLLNKYRKLGSLSSLTKGHERYAKNIISWQMSHGGFGLHDATLYEDLWDGNENRSEWVSKGRELGNFDDGATVAELRFLADVYSKTTDNSLKSSIKASVNHCLQFIFKSQYKKGGWPQVYPRRFNQTYSNNITLNDHAMVRVMVLLSDILVGVEPFNTDLVTDDAKAKIYPRLSSAVDYLLSVQIKNNHQLTIWSAQYDPETDTPAPGRSYELVSKSGRESVGVLAYLMNWPEQNEKVIASVLGGISWYEVNKVSNTAFKRGEFYEKKGSDLWYRFYDVDNNVPFFSGRDGLKKYDLALVESERRNGYSWGDSYGSKILRAAPFYIEELESK